MEELLVPTVPTIEIIRRRPKHIHFNDFVKAAFRLFEKCRQILEHLNLVEHNSSVAYGKIGGSVLDI